MNYQPEELLYKPDWPEAWQRFQAWWSGQVIDRAAIQVIAPKDNPETIKCKIPAPDNFEECWTNVEYRVEKALEQVSSTFWGGEAFPHTWPNLGPSIMGAYLGNPLHFAETTAWQSPIINSWDSFNGFVFDPENKWWKITKEITSKLAEQSEGKFMVGITDLAGGGDELALMRGPLNLAKDLLDCPEKIKEALEQCKSLWFRYYQELYDIIFPKNGGSTGWMPIWYPGKVYPLQCDFSCMISPEMFEEFFLPYICSIAQWLDHSIYHLDGPEAIKHLDLLLEIPELDGIQWTPGAGQPSMCAWIPLLKKVQDKGKLNFLFSTKEDIEPILNALPADGLMFHVYCDSEAEARALLNKVKRWSHAGQ